MTPTHLPLLLTGAFLTSLVLSLSGTYLVRGWAIRKGFVDHPDGARRIHTAPTPNVGGVAIFVASLLSFVLWGGVADPDMLRRPEILSMLVGGGLIFLLGFWDDTHHLRAGTKFAVQTLIAVTVFLGGVRIMGVEIGGIWSSQLTGLAGLTVSVFWLVGTTNAFNLIDGSDGVAGGAAMFASIAMGVILALNGDPLGALMATILVGATLGFLFFNFPPASVFMGDSGSLFLGFTLASLGVITVQKGSTFLAITIPIIAFGIPLLDTSIAIVRRFLRHEPIFAPDRGHIHHRLKDLGHSPRRVAILLYVACAGCASLSMVLAEPGATRVLPVFVVAGAVLILAVQRLKVPELAELGGVFGRAFQQRTVISHNVRVHSATVKLSEASSSADIVEHLADAFDGSEFSAVELWVVGSSGGDLACHPLATPDGGGFRLRVDFDRVLHGDQEYKIQAPVLYEGAQVGRLSFCGRSTGHRLYTDIRLIARRLAPALGETLGRLAAVRTGEQPQTRV
ncbi:MAG: MraY family glycosyltransferase [Gemmatimonadota bacterium]|nr:MraY family glycosyltransferase [Gemmatimonadota bacterium]MDE3014083.1 MraY family glycosyltransferase [Gemmatimonadota bacterium]